MGGGGHKHRPPKHGHVKQSDQWHEPPKPKAYEDAEARAIGEALQAIVRGDPHWASYASKYAAELGLVDEGVHGKAPAERCILMIETGMTALEGPLASLDSFPEGKRWLDEEVREPIARIRKAKHKAIKTEQTDTAENRVTLTDPGEDRPHERAILVRDAIGIVKLDIESIVRMGEHDIHEDAEALWNAVPDEQKRTFARWGVGNLVDIQTPLLAFDGLLKLSDEAFLEEVKNADEPFKKLATYTELVSAALEFVGGCAATGATLAGHFIRLIDDPAKADVVLGFARLGTLKLSNVLTVVELVHGLFTLLDSTATRDEKINAGVDIGISSAWLYGAPELGAALVGAKMALAFLSLAGGAIEGAQNLAMHNAFEMIRQDGDALMRDGEYVARAETLLKSETDRGRKAGLHAVHEKYLKELKTDVLRLAEDTAATRDDNRPGGWPVLVELFAPVATAAPRMTSSAGIVTAVQIAVDRVVYAAEHHADLVVLALEDKSLGEMQREQKQEEDERAVHDYETAERDRKMREDSQWDRHH